MDEYLEEETEYVKQALETICRTWDQQVSSHLTCRELQLT